MTEDVEAQNTPRNEEAEALTEEKQVEIQPAEEKQTEATTKKGLSKEELLHYANDPFWIKLRITLFALFWVIWTGMLVASVVIIIYAPKCPSPEPKTWWQKGPIYKISKDDFPGLEDGTFFSRLADEMDYVVEAGFNTLYLGNIFKTGGDQLETSPDLGSLQDWTALVEQMKQRDIKVIIDLSTEMNAVPQEVVSTWASRGVAGFNLAAPAIINSIVNGNQDGKDTVIALREELDSLGDEPMILTAFTDLDLTQMAHLYGDEVNEVHVGPLFHLVSGASLAASLPDLTSTQVFDYVNNIQNKLPASSWPAIQVSSGSSRVADMTEDMVDAVNMLANMLKATPIVHAGDELGLSTMDWTTVRTEQTEAKQSGGNSHLAVFSQMAELRHTETILFGDVRNDDIDGCSIITRVKKGNPGYVLIMNMNSEEATIDISKIQGMGETIRTRSQSVSAAVPPPAQDSETGEQTSSPPVTAFSSAAVRMAAREAKLFTFVPNFE
eukprot:TRINITY_DN12957_c0_g1_i3.p1 TRINITY_DN12957_c0_g1~~TRINITY_DN12957_c0_g1_i3.p1  ORF type:complete len:496 (+),score=115.65 TRINITY_DN12957_c0_g1_i3:32-1519(+)